MAKPPGKWLDTLFILLVAGFFLAGIAAVTSSFLPFGLLQAKARGFSATGQITHFTHEFYQAMQVRLRVIGAAEMSAVMALFILRGRIYGFARQVSADSLVLRRDISSRIGSLPGSELLTLAGLVLFAGILRIPHLFEPMRYDEAYTFLQYSSHPFYVALSYYNLPNNHLFHTLLVRLAYLAFGDHPWALRLPAFLAGLCLVPATYAAARSLHRTGGAALLAAGLVASSSTLIEYSTNARGYSILCLIFIVLIPLAAYLVRHGNWAAWVLVAVLSALGFYTIPIMLYPFGAMIVWLLFCKPHEWSTLAQLAVAVGLTALVTVALYLPVFVVTGPRSVVANRFVAPNPFHVFLHDLPLSFASTWRQWNRDWPPVMTLVLLAGFAIALLWHRRRSLFRLPLVLAVVLWVVPLLFVQQVIPFERVWLFLLPLYLITSAAGVEAAITPALDRLRFRHATVVLAIAIALFLGLRVQRSRSIYLLNYGRGLDATAVYLKGQLKPGDSVVVAEPSNWPLQYYFHKEGVPIPYIYVNPSSSNRMFVVVNDVPSDRFLSKPVRDTLQDVLAKMEVRDQGNRPARFLARYDSASLYEIVLRNE